MAYQVQDSEFVELSTMLAQRYEKYRKTDTKVEKAPDTPKVTDHIDPKIMQYFVDKKYVSMKVQKDFGEKGLILYNYTAKCSYEKMWNTYTLAARGLITDLNGNIVLRPFSKFFNIEEWKNIIPHGQVEVYEKVDGSMIVAGMSSEHGLVVASRGSFESDQAQHALALLNDVYGTDWMIPDLTYIFEVIYPENRIVVNYGRRDELVLLGVQNAKGEGWSHSSMTNADFPFKVAEHIATFPSYDAFLNADLKKTIQPNSEGYVLRFANEFRLKLKGEEYLRLHRIVTNTNNKTVWEMCKDSRDFEDLITNVPDEFMWWIKQKRNAFVEKFEIIEQRHKEIFERINDDRPRTEFAAAVSDYQRQLGYEVFNSAIMYRMKDGKPYDDLIWNAVRPLVLEKPPVGETDEG